MQIEFIDRMRAERKRLRSDSIYIGTLMLVLLAAMQLTFSAVVMVLAMVGVIDFDAIQQTNLGFDNTTYLLIYGAVYSFVFVAPTLVVTLLFRRRLFPPTSRANVAPVDGFLSVIGMVGGCLLTSIVVSYVMNILENFGVPMPEMPALLENTPASYALNLAVIAVLPALLEEWLFRGCVLRTFRAYGDGFAIVMSALLFGLMHGNIVQIPFAFIVGLLLGWLYVVTDNIWFPIAVHFANNALSVSMEYLSMNMDVQSQNVFGTIVYALIVCAGAASVIVLIIKKSSLFHRLENPSIIYPSERLKTALFAPTLLISLICFVILTALEMVV